ncbi:MAG: hypothetical protein AAB363_09140, partial [Planctomycetota bacterium]
MDLFVDDKKVDDDRVVGGTLAETLHDVQANCCPPPRILVGFRCDGNEVVGAAMASTLCRPAGSFELLEVFTSTREDLVADAMNQASASLEETEGVTQNVAELLMEGKAVEGIARLGECLRIWQQIHDAVAKSLELLRLNPEQVTVRDEPLLTALERPKDVLLQIKGALQAHDHVLLADILQFEFAD